MKSIHLASTALVVLALASCSAVPARVLEHGVATLPRGMMYLSAAHTDQDIDATLRALTEANETVR